MDGKIETLGMARAMMAHAQTRQLAIARNVANADTPGFRARDVAPFDPHATPATPLKMTHARHIGDGPAGTLPLNLVDAGGEAAPNGNTVSLEEEMMRSAETTRDHELALTIYQSGLRLLRGATGRRG